MVDAIICLDAGVWIKFLVVEEPTELSAAAATLVLRALTTAHLVAPAFAWAEVGSVVRKKVRQRLLTREQAKELWAKFSQLPIEFIDTPVVRARAWEIAEQYRLPTLYDAAFLACTELTPAPRTVVREYWTADQALLRSLETNRPSYIRQLGMNG